MYLNIPVQNVRKYSGCTWIINTSYKWCMNIKDYHKNKTIYFIIRKTKKGIYVSQKCYCRCDHTGCNKYESQQMKLPLSTFIKLI